MKPAQQPRLAAETAARCRFHTGLLVELTARLTDRDRHIIRMVGEHRVLTTPQVARLAFGSITGATHRLLALWRLHALDRFRPWTPTGSAPYHYVLGQAGAHILAAEAGITLGRFGYRRDKTLAIAYTRTLAHTLGVNDFFTTLAHHARTHPQAELVAWWPEHRCAKHWGDLVRPDAYGCWREHAHQITFFLEHDTGTENLERLAAKLAAYTQLAQSTGQANPVLFWLPNPTRETHLRQLLAVPPIPAATAAGHNRDPAEAIWLPAGQPGPRRRLAQLAIAWTPPASTSNGHDRPGDGWPEHEW